MTFLWVRRLRGCRSVAEEEIGRRDPEDLDDASRALAVGSDVAMRRSGSVVP